MVLGLLCRRLEVECGSGLGLGRNDDRLDIGGMMMGPMDLKTIYDRRLPTVYWHGWFVHDEQIS